jgi:hypothetical protein
MSASTTEKLLNRSESVSEALLPAIFNIFDKWRLAGKEQMTLLGLTNEKTLYNWKNKPAKAKLSKDVLERASYILGIYKALQILLPVESKAGAWLSGGNDNPYFGGQRPLDRMLAGQVVDLAGVRNFLDAERGGW